MPRPRIILAGFGLITPLGNSAWETYRALLAGRTLADRTAKYEPDLPPIDIAKGLGKVSVAGHSAIDPAVELAERAAREAAAMAGVPLTGLPTFLGTSKGAVARLSERTGRGLAITEADALNVALGPHGYLAHCLAQRTGLVPRTHRVAACASSLYALDTARRALAHGIASDQGEFALVLTADAALTPAFISSYRRLGVLAELTLDGYRQRPLDQRREGFMLAETGAAVLLRRLPVGQQPAAGAIELVDTACASEAQDMIRTRPTMPALEHVARRLLPGRRIDVLHPHAPGTRVHDPAELSTLLRVLGSDPDRFSLPPDDSGTRWPPDVYAVKGAIGHGLGAAGLASLVVAALALTTGKRPPMPWLDHPIAFMAGSAGPNPALSLDTGYSKPVPCDRSGTHGVFAAGFGGHTAGVVIRRWA